jgi:DNA polymerase-3 subunit gamma/tau
VSYQVLARKWRPQNFSQVVGQPHVLTALSNGLAQNRVHHAYLFSGTRGVGKTTIARILAKSLNCEQGVTATPCGKCENCVAIDQGRFVDLLEIDAASRTKVDDTRELLDNVQYKPAVGRYKVYLIDEVHMLSKHSFNALLKTLEEPPEYVKFLLATTDPQKLPITVLSRCLQFHLKAILPEQIEAQLEHILQKEKATFEHRALNIIAKAADGSMRDALSLTDQALAFGAGNIEYSSVLKMLGTLDNSHLQYLLHFIASGNVTKVFQKIEEFVALGADFAKLHQELAGLCHQIALQQLQRKTASSDKSAIQLLSERLSPEEVQLYYQIALEGYKDYRFAPNGKVALEMTVMRLLAFKPANYIEQDEVIFSATVEDVPFQVTSQKEVQAEINHQEKNEASIPKVEAPATKEPETAFVAPTQTPIIDDPTIERPVANQSIIEQSITEKPEVENVVVEHPVAETPVTKTVTENEIGNNYAAASEQSISEEITPLPESTNMIAEESMPVTPLESIGQLTSSRNMLRSHRLKRNEIKKLQATTEQNHSNDEPVVATSNSQATQTSKHSSLDNSYPKSVLVEPTVNSAAIESSNIEKNIPLVSSEVENQITHGEHLQSSSTISQSEQQFDERYAEQSYDPYDSGYSDGDYRGNDYEPYIPPGEMQQAVPLSVEHPMSMPLQQPEQNESIQADKSPQQYASIKENTVLETETSVPATSEPKEITATKDQDKPVEQTKPVTENQKLTAQTSVQPSLKNMPVGKHDFFTVQEVETIEIDKAKYVEDKLTDPWSLAIQQMQLHGLTKLLAKNCVMKKVENQIVLTLKAEQQHLLNNGSLCEELQIQLKSHYGPQYSMYIEVGDVKGELTAFESEEVLYEQYLNNAKHAIVDDENIQKLVNNCGAKVYENSVIPL